MASPQEQKKKRQAQKQQDKLKKRRSRFFDPRPNKLRRVLRSSGLEAAQKWAENYGCVDLLRVILANR